MILGYLNDGNATIYDILDDIKDEYYYLMIIMMMSECMNA